MNKLAKYIVGITITLVIAFLAWYFSNILIYILISAVLSLIGKPLKSKLLSFRFRKFSIPNGLAAGITLVLLLSIFFSIFIFVTPLIGKLLSNLSTINFVSLGDQISIPLTNFNKMLHEWFPALDPSFKIEEIFINQFEELLNISFISELFNSIASVIIEFGIALFVIIFITYFFLKEENMFNDMVLALFPDKYVMNVSRALSSINRLLARYFIGISIEAIAITIINSFGLYIIAGVDISLAIALSFLAGIINVIPYIGPITGGVFGAVISLVNHGIDQPEAGIFILTVGGIFLATHMIDIFVFQPYIYSNSVKAHPLEIFLVILIAGSIGGIIGMLVAIPAYTVIRVFAREFLSHFKLVQKLTDNF
ncbi:MAG: AI-2E family transporter [Rikenellaceae bacterium]